MRPFVPLLSALAAAPFARVVIIGATILAIVSAVVWQSLELAQRSELRSLDAQLRGQLDTFAVHVQSQLDALELAPNVLTQSREIATLFAVPSAEAVATANQFLERFVTTVHASDAYVLDASGVTLAASNWRTDHSFVGQNYAFRPYFIDARGGGTGRFVAVGVTSGALGYYVAVPVWGGGKLAGVAIVKYAIDDLLRAWHRPRDAVAIADAGGIIFATNRPDLQFRTLSPLSDEAKKAVRASKQYPSSTEFEPLPSLPPPREDALPLVELRSVRGADSETSSPGIGRGDFIVEQRDLANPNWRILALTQTTVDGSGTLPIVGLGVLTAAILLLLLVYVEDRRRARRVLAAHHERLRRNEAHLAHAQQLAAMGSWELDIASGAITWSEEHYCIAGVARDEFVPSLDAIIALFHRDDQQQVALHLADAMTGLARDGIRARLVRPNGTVRHVQCACQPVLEEGKLVGVLGTTQDVTLTVEAEAVVRGAKERAEAAEARLLEALETMSEGFVLFGADDRLVLCNRVYREIYAESADLILPGARFEDMLRAGVQRGQYPAAIGREEEWIQERLAQRRLPFHDMEQALPNGRWVRVVERSTDSGGRLGIRIDITPLKRREDELSKAKEEAEQASRAKTQILANMSHELRTPLNAIMGFSEVIRDAVFEPVPERYRSYAVHIYSSGQHLLNLINDVLDLAKIETGRFELHEEEVKLIDLVATCLPIIDRRAKEGGVELRTAVAADLPRLWADRLRLKQIVLNLLSNAVKFTPRGGNVTISAMRAQDRGLTISVSDTGIGMRADEIPVALEPFRQVEGDLSRRYEGTGLGLPLAKQLTELHGGALRIESEPGQGTTVTVSLPQSRVISAAA